MYGNNISAQYITSSDVRGTFWEWEKQGIINLDEERHCFFKMKKPSKKDHSYDLVELRGSQRRYTCHICQL